MRSNDTNKIFIRIFIIISINKYKFRLVIQLTPWPRIIKREVSIFDKKGINWGVINRCGVQCSIDNVGTHVQGVH